MRILAVVIGALLLASLYDKAHCQCDASWSQSTYTVDETSSLVVLTAQLVNPAVSQIFLQWSTRSNTATADVDYNAASGILRFDPGDSEGQVSIIIRDDSMSESDETFYVDLQDLNSNDCDTADVVIVDDEPEVGTEAIEWEQSNYTFSEGSIAQVCAGNPDLITSITVTNVEVTAKNATDGADFLTDLSGDTWEFTSGDPVQCINLFFPDDDNFEGLYPESFCISFVDNNETRVTEVFIEDNDPLVTIVWEFDFYEFEEGGTFEICAVTNDTIVEGRIETRQVVLKNGTATADEDYYDPEEVQEVVFQAGDERQCVEIQILNDDLLEGDECFFACLVSDLSGIEMSTTKIVIEDDEGDITVSPENEIYTVVEGNVLEVCVVTANNTPAAFEFHLIGYFYLLDYHIFFRFYFFVGDFRSCANASIPGNTYVDKKEREQQIFFEVEDSEFSEFVTFDRSSAWVFVTDDDIVSVGFSSPYFSALEDDGSVSVCIQLCEGTLNRPIDFLLYTNDGTAVAGTNYEQAVRIVTLPALGVAGDQACTEIVILDDGLVTGILNFSLSLYIADTHVIIPEDQAGAVVHIMPIFEICFDMDSPRVNGSELFISFASTIPVDSADCSVETLGTMDCTDGSATFFFNDTMRTEPYDITVVATAGDEIRTLERDVRSELTGLCDIHLVNKGVIFDGNNATIYIQPTGPNQSTRITELECRCRPSDLSFANCPTGTSSESDSVHFIYNIPDGCTRLSIRQINDGDECDPRRAIQIDIPPM